MWTILLASSLTESLSDALRKEIIDGDLKPGVRLTEGWVAEHFNVARPTAKSGLERLIAEGILRRAPRRSTVVPLLSAADIDDIYFSREPIEAIAVAALASRREAPPDAERALALMRAAAERGIHSQHTEADIQFHRALVAAIASPRLRRMHDTVMGEAQLCIAQVRKVESVDLNGLTANHAAILDAIKDGNTGAAIDALNADLQSCRNTLLRDVERENRI